MFNLSTQNLTKKYGEFTAVDNVDIIINDGKFVCLLGPSGCGKTTLLRLIAGLEEATAGELLVEGVNQKDIPAHKRNFGMVFQSSALFPHLTVAENIAYPLKIRKVDAAKRRQRALELLDLVKLPGIADRRIDQLSGGQRQRVAIARGLAIDPRLFLLDEPLSALDAKLREHMQRELRLLQKKLAITTIVVTHDQREAMTMADIVIVMNKGKVLQIGTPMEIYRNPADSFVANFIGFCNLIPCHYTTKDSITILGENIKLTKDDISHVPLGSSGIFSIRPDDLTITTNIENADITGHVSFIRDLGASVEISVVVRDQEKQAEFELLSVCTPKNSPNVTVDQKVGVVFHAGRASVMAK